MHLSATSLRIGNTSTGASSSHHFSSLQKQTENSNSEPISSSRCDSMTWIMSRRTPKPDLQSLTADTRTPPCHPCRERPGNAVPWEHTRASKQEMATREEECFQNNGSTEGNLPQAGKREKSVQPLAATRLPSCA